MMIQGHDFPSSVQILRNWLEEYRRDLDRGNTRTTLEDTRVGPVLSTDFSPYAS